MGEPDIDLDRIDEAALALLYLTVHDAEGYSGTARAWKSLDWDVMNRLHEKGLIGDPVGKAKSVMLTQEGLQRSEALFYALFSKTGSAG
jgi:hypothetical protein